MADDPKAAKKAERRERLEAALRENLKRRKAQARQRTEQDADEPSGSDALPGRADIRRDD